MHTIKDIKELDLEKSTLEWLAKYPDDWLVALTETNKILVFPPPSEILKLMDI